MGAGLAESETATLDRGRLNLRTVLRATRYIRRVFSSHVSSQPVASGNVLDPEISGFSIPNAAFFGSVTMRDHCNHIHVGYQFLCAVPNLCARRRKAEKVSVHLPWKGPAWVERTRVCGAGRG